MRAFRCTRGTVAAERVWVSDCGWSEYGRPVVALLGCTVAVSGSVRTSCGTGVRLLILECQQVWRVKGYNVLWREEPQEKQRGRRWI